MKRIFSIFHPNYLIFFIPLTLSKVLSFGKLQINLHFRSLIHTFATPNNH